MQGALPAVGQGRRRDEGGTSGRSATTPPPPCPLRLLTAREECELGQRVSTGDLEARQRLIEANLRLVVRIAQDFQGRGMTLEDLIGEGNLGLTRAADRYDPRYGTRFSTYASYWIKEAIRAALCNTSTTIRIPAHTVALLNRWRVAERALRRETGRQPTHDEVAARLGLSASQVEMAAQGRFARRVVSGGGSEADGADLLDVPAPADEPPDAPAELEDEIAALGRRLDRLDSLERAVITLRFGLGGGDPMTLMEVGQRLGVTREWVRKLELRAVQKLR